MSEDYLWNKTGEDTDIELLENALQTFRYRETAPPALPAKIIPFAPSGSRRIFRFVLAFSACAALIITGLSVWFYASANSSMIAQGEIEINFDFTPPTAPPTIAPVIDSTENPAAAKPKIINTNISSIKRVFVPNYAVERKIVKTPDNIRFSKQLNAVTAGNIVPKEKKIKLTKEEKFAYNQLMLALSITSEKLKIVKDKAEGLNKETNTFSDGK